MTRIVASPLCGILNRESLEIIILIKNFLDQLI